MRKHIKQRTGAAVILAVVSVILFLIPAGTAKAVDTAGDWSRQAPTNAPVGVYTPAVTFYPGSGHRIEIFLDPQNFVAYAINGAPSARIPGGFQSNHAPAVVMFQGQPLVYLVGTDGRLWYNHYQGNTRWGGWTRAAGIFTSQTPGVVTMQNGGSVAIVYVEDDGSMWAARQNANLSFTALGPVRTDGKTFNTPAIVNPGSNTNVLSVYHTGTNGHIYYATGTTQGTQYTWGNWVEIPGNAVASTGPSVVTSGFDNDDITVAIRGLTSTAGSNVMWYTTFQEWGGWEGNWYPDRNGFNIRTAPTLARFITGVVYAYIAYQNGIYGKFTNNL